jgi:tetratricopeptide (TPR) repeat protein
MFHIECDSHFELDAADMSTDWFRNTTWNEVIEKAFNQKLSRARKKAQYLRIQAGTLTNTHPEVALRLLDQYFALNDNFENALAHVHRANAFIELGHIDDAIESYKSALAREVVFPNFSTRTYLDLPYLIATLGIKTKYGRASQLLETNENQLMFPVDHFLWHATYALMAFDVQNFVDAKTHARHALEAAAQDDSGLRYHPTVGLVSKQYDYVIQRLEVCSAT